MDSAQFSLGDHADAVESLRRLVSLRPENGRGLLNLGASLFELGQIDLAIEAFRKSLDHIPAELQDSAIGNIAVIIPGSPSAKNRHVLDRDDLFVISSPGFRSEHGGWIARSMEPAFIEFWRRGERSRSPRQLPSQALTVAIWSSRDATVAVWVDPNEPMTHRLRSG